MARLNQLSIGRWFMFSTSSDVSRCLAQLCCQFFVGFVRVHGFHCVVVRTNILSNFVAPCQRVLVIFLLHWSFEAPY